MTLTTVEPFLWLIGVLLFYISLGGCIVCLLTSIRLKQRGLATGCGLLLLLLIGGILRFGSSAVGLTLLGLSTTLLEIALYHIAFKPRLNWQGIKRVRETIRQTCLHLILSTGSLIFLIPFAWLIVTSLKEDKEMSKFPPVWIPTQQVKLNLEGRPRGLANTTLENTPVKIAIMEEFETGTRKVRVLEPAHLAGREFITQKDLLTEIRQFAPLWQNYPNALKFLPPETKKGLVYLGNTLQVSLLSIIGTLLASSMAAYSFSRLKWPGRDGLFLALLATMMLPAAVTMMPVFLIFRWLGWVDTLKPLWVPAFFGSAFNIFLLRQFFLGIPTELEEAARIDGCSYYAIFWRIMLPQLKPALAALTIMGFMGAWNDFRGPLIYISSPENQPLAYALQLFQTARSGEPGLLMAASAMVMLPVLLLFFFTQRYFIQGITLTGIKG
jgi:multiple sugar transport system permease protein